MRLNGTWATTIAGILFFLGAYTAFQFFQDSHAERVIITLVAWYLIYLILGFGIGLSTRQRMGQQYAPWWHAMVAMLLILIQISLYLFTDIKETNASSLAPKIGLVYAVLSLQWLLLILCIAWFVWSLLTFFTLIWSLFIRSCWRIRNAVWTTQIANTCSGMLLGTVTLSIWWALSTGGSYYVPQVLSADDATSIVYGLPLESGDTSTSAAPDDCNSLIISPFKNLYCSWYKQRGAHENTEEATQTENVIHSTTVFLNTISSAPMAFSFLSFLVLAIVCGKSLRKAVSAEFPNEFVHPFRPQTQASAKEENSPTQTYAQNLSQAQGQSLSNAYRTIGSYSRIWFAISVFLTILTPFWISYFDTYYLPAISQVCIAITSVIFLAIISRRTPYSEALATVLDVASDVVNWLRLSPIRQNVTSKIYARYDSVLKHISNKGYTRCDTRS